MFKKKLQGTKTYILLKEAYAAECYSEQRFRLFAAIAHNEGLPLIEAVFNELAQSQHLHGKSHFEMLQDSGEEFYGFKVGNTLENIKAALAAESAETDECTKLIAVARSEGLDYVAERIEEIALDEIGHIHRLNALNHEIVQWS